MSKIVHLLAHCILYGIVIHSGTILTGGSYIRVSIIVFMAAIVSAIQVLTSAIQVLTNKE